MTYLLTQMTLYMLCALILGVILGWLLWGRKAAQLAECRETCARLTADKKASMRVASRVVSGMTNTVDNAVEKAAEQSAQVEPVAVVETPKPAAAMAAPIPVAAPVAVGQKPKGIDEPRGGQPDDLQKIKGVGAKMEQLLFSMGYFHFDQIGSWSKQEVSWVDDNLEGFKGRVTRDNWISQAKKLTGMS